MNPVKYILPAEKIDMGGFPVKQALPTQRVDQVDPYLLLHHARVKYSSDRDPMHQGVGPHPHRGFSPVTFIVEGELHHRDSRGHSQVAKAGEVQWMHAGMGIVHSERPTLAMTQSDGWQEFIQLWINTPAKHKMKVPTYQHLSESSMPSIKSTDGSIATKVVAGKYESITGTAETQGELLILWSTAAANGNVQIDLPKGHNTMLYLIKGDVKIDGHGNVDTESLVILETDTSAISIVAQAGAQWLILSGVPLNEKVTQYGPYVMNTQTEILEAMRDYQMGKMGILIEE